MASKRYVFDEKNLLCVKLVKELGYHVNYEVYQKFSDALHAWRVRNIHVFHLREPRPIISFPDMEPCTNGADAEQIMFRAVLSRLFAEEKIPINITHTMHTFRMEDIHFTRANKSPPAYTEDQREAESKI